MFMYTYLPTFSVNPPTYLLTNDTNHDATKVTHNDEKHNSIQEPAPTSSTQTADKVPDNMSKFKRRSTKRYLARQLKHKNKRPRKCAPWQLHNMGRGWDHSVGQMGHYRTNIFNNREDPRRLPKEVNGCGTKGEGSNVKVEQTSHKSIPTAVQRATKSEFCAVGTSVHLSHCKRGHHNHIQFRSRW